jgi:D-glycero-D-manno-heptose 1,7-bisphosphate phosphatase
MENNKPFIHWSGDPVYDNVKNIAPKCVIGLDRDGVINKDLWDYCYKPEDFEPIEGSLEAITKLRRAGHKIVIITNQGGIEKGIYTQEDVDKTHEYLMQLLGQAGCMSIDGLYYSASSRKDDVYAKPNTGMFKRCEKEIPFIKFNQGYFVGDKLSDLKAAMKIGAKPILVRTGYGEKTEKELEKFIYKKIKKATKIFDNLAAFVDTIV